MRQKQTYKQYSKEYKEEAVSLEGTDRVTA